jgi:hypothetical protein
MVDGCKTKLCIVGAQTILVFVGMFTALWVCKIFYFICGRLCDGDTDCPDGSDESAQECGTKQECRTDQVFS